MRLRCNILNEAFWALTITINLSIFDQLDVGPILNVVQVFHNALFVGLMVGLEDLLDHM